MSVTHAWMLRQDGAAFSVGQHIYVMNTCDFSSEADAASFLLYSKSKDSALAELILDVWMAKLIENKVSYDADDSEIEDLLAYEISHTPYHMTYELSVASLLDIHRKLNNFHSVATLYDFLDNVDSKLSELSDNIKLSLNQQFCRVRYGGMYRGEGSSVIWFRISSVGYNWANTIYKFTADMYTRYNIAYISICRDYESDFGEDEGNPEYFYRAKDGTVYFNLPISEYFAEDHEHSPVFSARSILSGVLSYIQSNLAVGATFDSISEALHEYRLSLPYDVVSHIRSKEQQRCIDCSTFLDNAPTRTRNRIAGIVREIKKDYPEITSIDTDVQPYPNRKGNMVGLNYIFELESPVERIDHLKISVPFTRSDATPDMIIQRFKREYDEYLEFSGIRI